MQATSERETAVTAPDQLTRRQVARRQRAAPGRVTGRLKQALDLMIYDNATDNEAAVQTGMTLAAIRLALRRTHVRAYLREQRDVLFERESGRNLHTLIEVRDQTANQMARVAAVKEFRRANEDEPSAAARRHSPGVVFVITGAPADMAHIREIEAKPLIDNEVVPHDE